jgi:hypothetical protein
MAKPTPMTPPMVARTRADARYGTVQEQTRRASPAAPKTIINQMVSPLSFIVLSTFGDVPLLLKTLKPTKSYRLLPIFTGRRLHGDGHRSAAVAEEAETLDDGEADAESAADGGHEQDESRAAEEGHEDEFQSFVVHGTAFPGKRLVPDTTQEAGKS